MINRRINMIGTASIFILFLALTACNNNSTSSGVTQIPTQMPTNKATPLEAIPTTKDTINPTSLKLNGTIYFGRNDLIFPFGSITYLNHNNLAYIFYSDSSIKVKRIKDLDGIKEIINLRSPNYLGLFNNGVVKYWNEENITRNNGTYTFKDLTCSKIAGSFDQVFFLKTDGTVWYINGLMTSVANIYENAPKQVNELKDIRIIDIATANNQQSDTIGNYLIALASDGRVLSWNNYLESSQVTVLYENRNLVSIGSAGLAFSVITKQGELFRWGTHDLLGRMKNEEVGVDNRGGFMVLKVPTKMNLPGRVKQISLGFGFVLALLDDGTLWGWGIDAIGEEGYLDPQVVVPGPIANKIPLTGIDKVYANYNTAIAYMKDGTIKKWGANDGKDIFGGNSYKNIKTIKKFVIKNNVLVNDYRKVNDARNTIYSDG